MTAYKMTRSPEGGVVTREPQMALPLETVLGDVAVYTIVLRYLPPSKNVFDGWKNEWKSGHKKKWLRDVAQECEASMVPKGLTQVGLAATLVFPSKNRRDPQNYAQCLWNFVPDALVKCGVLVDDNEGRIQIGRNWGLKFAYDTRNVPKVHRQKTILTLAVRV